MHEPHPLPPISMLQDDRVFGWCEIKYHLCEPPEAIEHATLSLGGKGVRAKGRSKLHDGTFFRTHRTPISLPFGNLNDDIPETRQAPIFSRSHALRLQSVGQCRATYGCVRALWEGWHRAMGHVLPFSPSLHYVHFPVPCAGSCPQDTPEFWPLCSIYVLSIVQPIFQPMFHLCFFYFLSIF